MRNLPYTSLELGFHCLGSSHYSCASGTRDLSSAVNTRCCTCLECCAI